MSLLKPTVWFRSTLTTKGEWIIPPGFWKSPPAGSFLRVTLCIRETPEVQIAFDVDPSAEGSRDSYWPEPPLNKTLSFTMRPDQTLAGRAGDSIHELSVIVEFCGG